MDAIMDRLCNQVRSRRGPDRMAGEGIVIMMCNKFRNKQRQEESDIPFVSGTTPETHSYPGVSGASVSSREGIPTEVVHDDTMHISNTVLKVLHAVGVQFVSDRQADPRAAGQQ